MGRFASVEPSVNSGVSPSARVTDTAAATIGASAGRRPAGRSPTSILATDSCPLFAQRAFSAASAASTVS